jgi:hypothetical protein
MSTQATRHFQKFTPISGGNDGLKKKTKTWNFNKSFKSRNSCEKTLSNILVLEPMNFPRSPIG